MTCVNVVCLLHRLNPCIHADINADINNIRRGRKPSQDAFTTAIASQLASDPASPLRGVASALTWHRQRAGLAAALNLSSIKIGDPNFMCVLYECHYPNSRHASARTHDC
jgi:hypothetical protein